MLLLTAETSTETVFTTVPSIATHEACSEDMDKEYVVSLFWVAVYVYVYITIDISYKTVRNKWWQCTSHWCCTITSEHQLNNNAWRYIQTWALVRQNLQTEQQYNSKIVCLSPNSTMPTSPWRPQQTRDVPLAQIPLCQLPWNFCGRGSSGEVSVMEFGLKGTSRVCRWLVADVTGK